MINTSYEKVNYQDVRKERLDNMITFLVRTIVNFWNYF